MKYLALLLLFAASSFAATPGLDTLVNYDTAWTYILDGGKWPDGSTPIKDVFYDVKEMPSGNCVFVGVSGNDAHVTQSLLVKIQPNGNIVLNKMYITENQVTKNYNSQLSHSLALAKNGDLIVGGIRYAGPYVMRLDTLGNIKWTSWYYDSINDAPRLLGVPSVSAINSIKETSRGTIICAVGEYFSDVGYIYGNSNNNAAGFLEFDSTGRLLYGGPLNANAGYKIGGFCVEEASPSAAFVAGNQAINYIDTSGNILWQKSYGLQVEGAGSQINNVVKCKKLRNSTFIVAGWAYEGNCWNLYQKLFYDAWWAPITSQGGDAQTWDTAGTSGNNDALYDFTQLNNGNLVFIGSNGVATRSVWTFVTDSTGKRVLWEKMVAVKYKSNNKGIPRGLSVCATKDGGFTVAGEYSAHDTLGGYNALAMHYVPKEIATVKTGAATSSFPNRKVAFTVSGHWLTVHNRENTAALAMVEVYDLSGRCIARRSVDRSNRVELPATARGTCILRMGSASQVYLPALRSRHEN